MHAIAFTPGQKRRRIPKTYLAGIVLLFGLSGCTTGIFDGNKSLGPSVAEINAMPPSQATAVLAGSTVMTFDPGLTYCTSLGRNPICHFTPGHGTQVEYFDPSGLAFLWYPGNSRAVPSRWNLQRRSGSERYNICFRYPSNSYNPITNTRGGQLECRDLVEFARSVTETHEGDPFNLKSGRLPHKLSAASTTFEELKKEAAK